MIPQDRSYSLPEWLEIFAHRIEHGAVIDGTDRAHLAIDLRAAAKVIAPLPQFSESPGNSGEGKCGRCGGDGIEDVEGGTASCGDCYGTGRAHVRCPACKGEGRVEAGPSGATYSAPCTRCKSRGYVPAPTNLTQPVPGNSDGVEEALRRIERGEVRERSGTDRGCEVRYAGHDPEFTCLDRQAEAEDPDEANIADEFRARILKPTYPCYRCQARKARAASTQPPSPQAEVQDCERCEGGRRVIQEWPDGAHTWIDCPDCTGKQPPAEPQEVITLWFHDKHGVHLPEPTPGAGEAWLRERDEDLESGGWRPVRYVPAGEVGRDG